MIPPDREWRPPSRHRWHRDGSPDCDCFPECPECGEEYDPNDGHKCPEEEE